MKFFFTAILAVTCQFGFCQPIFEQLEFKEAIKRASEKRKFVFLVLKAKDCNQCNDVANKGLKNPFLQKRLERDYICIRPEIDSRDWQDMQDKFGQGFGVLFFNSKGLFLNYFKGSTSRSQVYIEQIDIAEANLKDALQLQKLTKSVLDKSADLKIIEDLIVRRQKLQLPNDSIVEKFVSLLPADSIKSKRILKLLIYQSPMLSTKTNTLIRKDLDLLNQVWFTLSLKDRVAINNAIIGKTRARAVELKDKELAYAVANFASAVQYDRVQKAKNYRWNIMEYHREVKDTLSFLAEASIFYDRFYMKISVDSIHRLDSVERQRKFKESQKKGQTDRISIISMSSYFARNLNNGAWFMYTFRVKNIEKALEFSKRAVELNPEPNILDTYARLLYRSGKVEEAINEMTKAIEKLRKYNMPSNEFEGILNKMKNQEKSIDEYW
jgi:tetratricopeptide (TPR) repeat protein